VNLVKFITTIYSQGFYRYLFCIFLSLIVFSMYFRSSYEFLEYLKENGKMENSSTVLDRLLGPRPGAVRPTQRPRRPTIPSPRRAGARRARSPRDSRVGNDTVALSPSARQRPVDQVVFSASMGTRLGWRRAIGGQWGSPERRGTSLAENRVGCGGFNVSSDLR
jgi:hypothetical protein